MRGSPVSSLAALTGASRATVAARIDRLVENGTIAGFTIRTGHETRSAGVRAIVMIEVHGKLADKVAAQLRGLPQVRALHSTNGKWDFVAELEDRDLVSFDETLRRIRLIDGINYHRNQHSAEDQQGELLMASIFPGWPQYSCS